MFCKWCGQTVDPAKGKCAACGKELPPLSECGGFYNIMPEAKLAQVRKPSEEPQPARSRAVPVPPQPVYTAPAAAPVQQMRNPAPPVQQMPVAQEKKNSLVPVLVIALGLCLAALIITAIIAISSGAKLKALSEKEPGRAVHTTEPTRETNDEPSVPSENTSSSDNSSSYVGEETTEPPTEPTDPTEPNQSETELTDEQKELLLRKELSFVCEPSSLESGYEVFVKDGEEDVSGDFSVDVREEVPEDAPKQRTFVFRFADSSADIVKVIFRTAAPELPLGTVYYSISPELVLHDALEAEENADPEVKWEYKSADDEKSEFTEVTPEEQSKYPLNGSSLLVPATDLGDLVLRCTMTVKRGEDRVQIVIVDNASTMIVQTKDE